MNRNELSVGIIHENKLKFLITLYEFLCEKFCEFRESPVVANIFSTKISSCRIAIITTTRKKIRPDRANMSPRNSLSAVTIWFTVYIPIYQYWSFSSHYVSMCIYVGQGSFQYLLHFKLYQCNSNKRSLNLNYLSSHLQVLVIKSTLLSRIQTK